MSPVDLPPELHESITCSVGAAARHGIPANILLAVAEKEGGRPGQWVQNANGTSDVGPMQFNTAYLATLAKYGITPQAVAVPGCYPYDLAAWRLRRHLQFDQGDIWSRAANFHSRTPRYNAVYRLDLIIRSKRWADWLERCATGACPQVAIIPTKSAAPANPQLQPRRMVKTPQPKYVPRTITVAPKA